MLDYHVLEEKDDELDLELEDIARMPVRERYAAAIGLSLAMVEMMERLGHREPATVLQRPAR